MAYLKNDAYVCTMYGEGSSNCYCTLSYNATRNGNSVTYSGTLSLRMGSSSSYSFYRWIVTLKAGSVKLLDNYQIKGNHGNANIYCGTKWFSANFSYTVNTNEGTTPLYLSWWSKNENYTLMSTHLTDYHLGNMVPPTPVAPSAPGTVTIPSSIAPDKTASISWTASSGGTNGVNGYEWVYSRDGGSNWLGFETYTTNRSVSLNLNSAGFTQNSKLRVAVRSYSTVNGVKYLSAWTYSSTTTCKFVAPSAPGSLTLRYNTEEPIPTATYTGTWAAPSETGTNGIGGYTITWLKNGAVYKADNDLGVDLNDALSIVEGNYNVGDTISYKVRAYTIGQGTKYYSGYTTSGSITIVSDKFLFLSQNGGAFDKRKIYISQNGGEFKEIKKAKFNLV